MISPTILAALIGPTATMFIAAVPFFISWGQVRATLDALKLRVAALEFENQAICDLRADMGYVRGQVDTLVARFDALAT